MGGTGDIAIGAVGALALAAIVVATARVVSPRRLQRRIWAFRVPAHESPKVIIETIAGVETDLYRRPDVGFGAVAAVAQLATALYTSRSGVARRLTRIRAHPMDLSFSTEEKADRWISEADTIIVGGPKSNQKTAEVLRAFGCQPYGTDQLAEDELLRRTGDLRPRGGVAPGLGLATQGNTIYWFGASYSGDVTIDEDPTPGTTGYNGFDFGVVLRLPSPTDANRRTLVVFGSQTFGVVAASSWLVNLSRPTTPRSVRAQMAKHKNVAVLVKANVSDGSLDGPPELQQIVVLADDPSPRDW